MKTTLKILFSIWLLGAGHTLHADDFTETEAAVDNAAVTVFQQQAAGVISAQSALAQSAAVAQLNPGAYPNAAANLASWQQQLAQAQGSLGAQTGDYGALLAQRQACEGQGDAGAQLACFQAYITGLQSNPGLADAAAYAAGGGNPAAYALGGGNTAGAFQFLQKYQEYEATKATAALNALNQAAQAQAAAVASFTPTGALQTLPNDPQAWAQLQQAVAH